MRHSAWKVGHFYRGPTPHCRIRYLMLNHDKLCSYLNSLCRVAIRHNVEIIAADHPLGIGAVVPGTFRTTVSICFAT